MKVKAMPKAAWTVSTGMGLASVRVIGDARPDPWPNLDATDHMNRRVATDVESRRAAMIGIDSLAGKSLKIAATRRSRRSR
jgi:hypothetical protein